MSRDHPPPPSASNRSREFRLQRLTSLKTSLELLKQRLHFLQLRAVPIPGAKNAEQAGQNAGALGWELSTTDMAALDAAALEGTNSLFNRFWQHG